MDYQSNKISIIHQAQIEVDMTLTSPNCPVAESMPQEIKWKVNRLPGILTTKVNIVFNPPWTKDMMSVEAILELGCHEIIYTVYC